MRRLGAGREAEELLSESKSAGSQRSLSRSRVSTALFPLSAPLEALAALKDLVPDSR